MLQLCCLFETKHFSGKFFYLPATHHVDLLVRPQRRRTPEPLSADLAGVGPGGGVHLQDVVLDPTRLGVVERADGALVHDLEHLGRPRVDLVHVGLVQLDVLEDGVANLEDENGETHFVLVSTHMYL